MSRTKTTTKSLQIRINHSDIVFENKHYIALNKKSGWLVHATLDKSRSNLFDALKSFLQQRDKLPEAPYLSLHQRLDRDTSGVIIFGKTLESNKVLSDIFSNHKCTKKYVAICQRTEKIENGTIDNYLKKIKTAGIEHMIEVQSGGQRAITNYQYLSDLDQNLALYEFEILTGRMHQIRIHAKLLKIPLLGDDLYGDKKLNEFYNSHSVKLHCQELSFFDTLTNESISIKVEHQLSIESKNSDHKLYILFHKPYNVLCQFTKQNENELCLSDYNLPKDIYPAGRLDKDSEGLLLLTNDGAFIDEMAHPKKEKEKTYWAQVENIPSENDLDKLRKGVKIENYLTKPAKVKILKNHEVPPRNPPIRERKNIPTCWLEIKISEGKNRQVRKMTAHIGFPTLRLIRVAIGHYQLSDLASGQFLTLPNKH